MARSYKKKQQPKTSFEEALVIGLIVLTIIASGFFGNAIGRRSMQQEVSQLELQLETDQLISTNRLELAQDLGSELTECREQLDYRKEAQCL